MRLFSVILYLIVSAFLLNCNSQKGASIGSSSTISPNQTAIKSENAIVYLFFTIEKETHGNELVKHTETKITSGTIKNASLESKENTPGNIRVTFLGKDGKEISERFIEDPLNPMMEVYAEEGINKEKMKLTKADFSVRFNQNGETVAVTLEKITNSAKKHLITIQL